MKLAIYQLTTNIFTGELKEDSGLGVLAKQFEIDVDEVGVEGAKTFFEAKVITIGLNRNELKFIRLTLYSNNNL